MADEATEADGTEDAASGGAMKKIILGVAALVLLAVGIFAGPVVKNMISPAPADDAATDAAADAEPANAPALYTSLHPPLVVNFKDTFGDSHFMQVTLEVMARDQDVINAVREHTPVIRNSLILLYGNVQYDEVTTREGKEQMLTDAVGEINKIMQEETGEEGVEAAYFTSLIIQ